MNIYVHEGFVEERKRRARRFQTFGMLAILLSFFLSFGAATPQTAYLIFLAYPFLLVGFPLWMMGRSTLRQLASAPHADVLLNAEMKGLNNKYSLHHYARLGETWVPHLLITPSGLIVMVNSDATGPVTCVGSDKGDRWKAPTNLLDRFTGLKPPIGNPTVELNNAVAAVKGLLSQIGKPEAPVVGVVLFTRNPTVQIEGCSFQGVPMNEARDMVREVQAEMDADREAGAANVSTLLTSEDRRRLNTILAPETIDVPPTTAKPAAAARR